MAKKTYQEKRDFSKTSEPEWKEHPSKGEFPKFVVQKHAARTLHYDFRLEINGVLKSWVIPKGPTANPEEKRLAIHVEDHPLDYADFEGTIPKGEYGGGTVMIWDNGNFANIKKWKGREYTLEESYDEGTMEFFLNGKKLKGGYALIKTKQNWLFFKMKDKYASDHDDWDDDKSVETGRTMEEIANS